MNKIISFFLELLFPTACVVCGRGDQLVCFECRQAVRMSNKRLDCSAYPSLDTAIVAADYHQPVLPDVISVYKYQFVRALSEELGRLLIGALRACPESFDIIVPVPPSKKRLLFRGFNQAELLAQTVEKEFCIPLYCDGLRRAKQYHSQVGLSGRRRRDNLVQGFKADAAVVRGKRVLLVDDVITTGTTVGECAAALKAAGATMVVALAVAQS